MIIFGEDALVGDWVAAKIPHITKGFKDFSAIGIVASHKELIGGVVYHEFRGNDIQMSVAATNKRWLSKNILFALFAYPFMQLGCDRVTAMTPKNNSLTRIFLEHLGFNQEGNIRRGFHSDDCIIYGMLREECRWIRNENG